MFYSYFLAHYHPLHFSCPTWAASWASLESHTQHGTWLLPEQTLRASLSERVRENEKEVTVPWLRNDSSSLLLYSTHKKRISRFNLYSKGRGYARAWTVGSSVIGSYPRVFPPQGLFKGLCFSNMPENSYRVIYIYIVFPRWYNSSILNFSTELLSQFQLF